MFPYPLSITVRRDALQRTIEQSGKGLHRFCIAADQHEWKIVTQRREIPIFGKNCGMQVARGKHIDLALGHSPREMKRDMRLKFCLHAKIALVVSV